MKYLYKQLKVINDNMEIDTVITNCVGCGEMISVNIYNKADNKGSKYKIKNGGEIKFIKQTCMKCGKENRFTLITNKENERIAPTIK